MSLAIENLLKPANEHPAQPISEETDRQLNIAVVFTSVESTLTALKEAGNLANILGARVTLIVPQVVPHPLSLETPQGFRKRQEPRTKRTRRSTDEGQSLTL